MEYTDYELVQKCIKGESEYFSEIVTRYKRLIYNVVYNMIHDKEEVNDISQEVFIRIYKSLDKYNPEFKFSTWTAKITSNLCLDIIRKKKPEQVPIDDVIGISSPGDSPEGKYIKKEKSTRIKEAIASLPDKYRLPIILFHQRGLSYEEITKILDEPLTIVKNRLYRARLMLREKLQLQGQEEAL